MSKDLIKMYIALSLYTVIYISFKTRLRICKGGFKIFL